MRGLSTGVGPLLWPSSYGPAERDEAYKSFSLSGWAGRSGHDAPMIALDALLAAGSDWEELMKRAAFHGGQLESLDFNSESHNFCFYNLVSVFNIVSIYLRFEAVDFPTDGSPPVSFSWFKGRLK